jgi:hypothetical protein
MTLYQEMVSPTGLCFTHNKTRRLRTVGCLGQSQPDVLGFIFLCSAREAAEAVRLAVD